MKKFLMMVVVAIMTAMTLTSCSDDDETTVVNPDQPVVLNCAKPDYLKKGDKVALQTMFSVPERLNIL